MKDMQTTALAGLKNSPKMKPLVKKLEGTEPFIWEMSPEEAEVILTVSNTFNRIPSPAKVKTYTAAIMRGEWCYTGASICFYDSGKLADGQHRLKAIAEAKQSIKTVVVPGLAPEAFTRIDVGKSRTSKDCLIMDGHSNPGLKSTAITIALKYTLHKKLRNVATPTTSQVLTFESIHSRSINTICNFSASLQEAHGQFINPGLIAASALLLYVTQMELSEKFSDFIMEAYSGSETNNQKPAYHLRRLLERHISAKTKKLGKLSQESIIGSILKAYKLEVAGKEAHGINDIIYPARKNEKFSVCL